ncbi:MAG TPA: RnfABCDGE type electron transport complex subunit D [Desulfohalobiaceae bacterium]|nr:RnfABCDGE type electron transport complex subunit D [Desulfohalobiaceae bacterium]
MTMTKLVVSPNPHVHSGNIVSGIMRDFIIALIPATLFALFTFGLHALQVVLISVVSAVVWEGLCQKLTKRPLTIFDLSGVCSGLILALLLPPTAPWWLILVGTLIMIILGKEVFGGFGSNPFNGVLIAWVVLQMSFPDYMSNWIIPAIDPATSLAPMEVLKDQGPSFVNQYFTYGQLFIGQTGGYLGQTSVLMLLIGGLYLLARRVINWRIPVCYLLGVFIFSGLFWVFSTSGYYADPVFHIFAGGTFLAAFFLATDMPSSPVTPQGMILFGLCAGILTVIIRTWGAWTFGAYYAVFILSMATPFLDKIAPEVYGR